MKWISKDQILRLYKDINDEFGGKYGIRDDGLLDSSINAPFLTFEGEDLYPDLISKSARLAYGIIRNHPFLDGNKRMGTHLMLILLSLNDIQVSYQDREMIDLIVSVAEGESDADGIYVWLCDHIKRGDMDNNFKRGVFWMIEPDVLVTCTFEEGETIGLSKSGKNYNHKLLWDHVKPRGCNKPFDYYPRGRVEMTNKGKTIVYMNRNIGEETLELIMKAFELNGVPKVHYDGSEHYKCHLDREDY